MNAKCRAAATGLCLLVAAGWWAPHGSATGDRAREELDLALAFSRTAARAAARAGESVLSVRAFSAGKEEYGSAVVVDRRGLALTVHHVVAGATSLAVVTRDGREFPARLRAAEPAMDLALLEILAPGETFAAATFAADGPAEVGESILAIGNPYGLGGSVSLGVVSARGRVGVVADCSAPMIQTDAAINPGCSGGALVNLQGELVGLIDAILTKSGSCEGIGFAIPVEEVAYAVPFLVRGERVTRPWLGLRVRTTGPAQMGAEGVEVSEIVPSSPAEAAGLRVGDRILRISGGRVGSVEELREILRRACTGDVLDLAIRREGKAVALSVAVGTRQDETDGSAGG